MNRFTTANSPGRIVRRALSLFAALLVSVSGACWLSSRFAPVLPRFVPELLTAILLTIACLVLLRRSDPRGIDRSKTSEQPEAEQIIEQVTEGILTINQHGLIVSLNPAAQRLFGYRSEEVLHEPVTKLLTEPPNENAKLFHDTMAMGTILGLAAGAREMVGRRKNGEMFPIELVMSAMTLGDEQVTVVFARDVSQRKQAQRYLTAHYAATCILAEADSLEVALPQILQSLSEALHWEACAYWSFDPTTEELCCEAIHQAPFAAHPHALDTKSLSCKQEQGLVGQVWSTGKPLWIEDILRTDNDPCQRMSAALQLQGGFAFPIIMVQEVCGVLALFSSQKQKRDPWLLDIMSEFGKQLGHFITRKRDEKMLQRSEERFRQLAENIQEVFWMMDARNDRIIYASPSSKEVWGQDILALCRSSEGFNCLQEPPSMLDFVYPEDQPSVRASMERQKRGETTSEEYRIVQPNGEVRWVWSRAFPVLDDANEVYRIVGITADVTDQKQLEERLRQSQKMEAVGQLAGGIAHDFNNLLTVIIGYSEILLSQSNPGDQTYELQEQIQKAGERAAALTRQLLAFGRKQTLQVRTLSINTVVQEMSKMLRRVIGEDIEMVLQQDPHLGSVQADPSQIEQILMNLATNARDAMPQGGQLTISTNNAVIEAESAESDLDSEITPGSYVVLTVADTGSGMSETTRQHAFEPFFTTKEIGQGTGLGLATVYGIVKQSRGHIKVDSELGRGTTFRIYLPRLDAEKLSALDEQRQSPAASGKETVLLVEDEDAVRYMVENALQSNGYTVLAASSGEQALKLCQEHVDDIALLVTDVIMPQMNGVQLAEQAASVCKDLKVLYISGYTNNILEKQGSFDASTAFLTKPVSPKVLAKKVREVLDARPCKAAL